MFGSEILDVFIGLFLVYWVFSIIASSVTELVAGLVKARGDKLKDGVELILQGDKQAVEKFFDHPVIKALRPVDGNDKYPSYLSAKTFARVYLSMRDELTSAIPQKVLNTFGGLVNDGSLQTEIEGWFNETMDRATGWYKRWSKRIIIIVGAVIVIFSNADTISLTNSLWQDPVVREVVVTRAEVVQTDAPSDEDITKSLTRGSDIKDELSSLSLLGWVAADQEDDPRRLPNDPGEIVLKFVGLAMTTFAVAMGAPFWFDLMGKLLGAKAALAGKSTGGGDGAAAASAGAGPPAGDAAIYHPPLPSTASADTIPPPPAAGPAGTAGTKPPGIETPADTGPPPVPPPGP